MDTGTTAAGGAGPAPFLLKTYDMVDDTATDSIVSWTRSGKSFVVWNPPEFARILLPSYFKHNNFSSFIRQLNTYGFRKIDPEKWEFSNEDFVKDCKHLLKNIHRRKPIHSHSQPQGSVDHERASFEEEIDKLSREKTVLEEQLMGLKDQQSAEKAQINNLAPLIDSIELRQERLLSYLEKSIQNPEFVERLVQKLDSMDFSAYNKKRRLPDADNDELGQDNVVLGNISDQDCNKLTLELSAAASNANLISHSTQSSNEDRVSPQGRINGCSSKDFPLLSSETVELSDTGASFNLDSSLSCKMGPETQNDEHICCLLNLTLASSSPPLELNKSPATLNGNNAEDGHRVEDGAGHNTQGPNDVFWEQFLTERPGCSDSEEASSSFRGSQSEDGKSMKGMARNTKGMEHLTL